MRTRNLFLAGASIALVACLITLSCSKEETMQLNDQETTESVYLKATSTSIVVRAHGTAGTEHMYVAVGGTTIGSWTLGTSYANYTATTTLASGAINVVFDNDASGRDVQVDYITVNGTTRQAEAQSTNTGVYQNSKCGGSYSEWMHCTGYIGFGDVGGGSSSSSSSSSSSGGSCSGGSVYLCFDDGPNSNTTTLVNNLKNSGAKATFFIWGNRISSNSSGFSAIKNAGYSIQNHSYTHSHMTGWSYQQVYNDLQQCQNAIKNAGGGTPTKVRLPYLETNATIQSACSALGLTIVQPTVDTKDWNGASTSAIVSACNSLQNGGNALMHDGYASTNAAISQIVQNLSNRNLCTAQY